MLKFLLSDNESLDQYLSSKFVKLDDIKRRMMLKSRSQNTDIPDHFYRLQQEQTFNGINSVGNVISKGLGSLTDEYLEIISNRVYIKQEQQNRWQELITYIPPLLLQSVFIYKETYVDNVGRLGIHRYYDEYILPNTRFTALPSSRIPQLEHFVNQKNGLHDLHMHLNGALETDQVWQDYLINPNNIYKDLKKGFKNSRVKEQLEQESAYLEPLLYINLLKIAQKIREYFFEYLFNENSIDYGNHDFFLTKLVNNTSDFRGGYSHPFLGLITSADKYSNLMSIESLMFILLLDEINKRPNELLVGLFHFYLLILGLTNRLLVQQTHQNGFEQFQKHTLNEMREKSESIYLRRYFQMQGNDLKNIRFLEGRFSPKSTKYETIKLLDSIFKGWDKMKIEMQRENNVNLSLHYSSPKLSLIAHFIKRSDFRPDPYIRHKSLRYDVMQKGKVLALLLKNHSKYKTKIVGIDAAASEFDTNPEVFAPLFRFMRRSGIRHFTYHAGEDFYHILDGLRAVYEAITFCDLRRGDRVGHATAAGLSVEDWSKVVGSEILMKQGDYLDNLIFTYHIILKSELEIFQSSLPILINEVQNLSFTIYKEHYSASILEKAWLMRQCCPLHTFESNKDNLIIKNLYDQHEWDYVQKHGFLEDISDLLSDAAYQVFVKYHDLNYRESFSKVIPINPFRVLDKEQLTQVQLEILKIMMNKEIVIETLPTSNVRIGFHKNFSTYQLKNWLVWKDEGKAIPPIVLGSDDTGIFATNIYNEYANIYCSLTYDHNISQSKIMKIIEGLEKDSEIYKFE